MISEVLLPLAREEGVDFAPGGPFFPVETAGSSWLRLNFVAHAPGEIEEGIERLGKAISRLMHAKNK
jgi:2-aminoadipate transaminase